MEGLDILDPQGQTVTFRGERLDIRPLTMGQLPRFSRLVRPVVNALLDSPMQHLDEAAEQDLVWQMLETHGEALNEAAAIAIGKPLAFVERAKPDEFLPLARAIVEVNRDFFTQLGVDSLQRASRSVGSGSTTSSTSSPTATH